MNRNQKQIPIVKIYSAKRWVVERTHSWHNRLERFSQDMKRRMITILGWYSSLVVLLSIEN